MGPTIHTDDDVRTILVPTDGSPASRAALSRALSIAEQLPTNADESGTATDAETPAVHVLAVADTTGDPLRFDSSNVHELEQLKEQLVAEIASAYEDHDVDVTTAIRRGHPAQTIVQYAADNDIDLIALGRTGQTGVTRLLGSTTDRVVRQSSIPVLVVPESNPDEE
ncbi:universal stress protein [Natronolimnobius sp. AArcel1]|uniref:universal stress protein n=1 Tax=Natronolimnobius sp. AArcel1 TaxID=1679093 RepID=UPI0013EA7CE0|nr:universal stress protein [Natronolimnobius sp. AArcel1]NGM70589.1 universal stress protein [Natronolimnobius sp. AArcel1]